MCGIAGILLLDNNACVEEDALARMRDAIRHRGPDDQGIFVDRNLGFAHTRLSIIGVETGAQPMCSPDERYWIVYNGETYNYRELRRDLQTKGYGFHTESDTEVILRLYEEYGSACVELMNGLFAFAIWDSEQRSLFVARDRMGIKPLYYAINARSFVFGSEIKALHASKEVPAAINDAAVYEYFQFRGVSGERTLFKNICSLLPGHRLTVNAEGLSTECYWSSQPSESEKTVSLDSAAEELESLLVDAVRIRLMSEVPLGTFCSGGVDSSLITALASTQVESTLNTFSVGFHEHDYDESKYAQIVSDQYGTSHHEIKLSSIEYSDLLPKLIELNDEPLHFANSLQVYAVSELAKRFVTVVLTGEGADELFLGYPRYHLPRLALVQKRLGPMGSLLSALGSSVLDDHRFNKIANYSQMSSSEAILFNAATSEYSLVNNLIGQQLPRELEYRTEMADIASDVDTFSRLSFNDQKTYLVSILNRQDKMSMGASVEARVPFIDYRIVEFANRLNSKSKIRAFGTKDIVKKVAARYLPKSIVHRKKSGFGVPLEAWFREEKGLGALADQVFHEARTEDYIDKTYLMQLWSEHKRNIADRSEILWSSLNFLLWKRQFDD
jgi:asparagine synthase (glutamine-hydrolysing)